MTKKIIGVRFQKAGKVYHFNASNHPNVQAGDYVIVETSRGTQLGEVASVVSNPSKPRNGGWKHIVRQATPRDLVLRQVWEGKEIEATTNCRAKVADLKLAGIKIVSAEYTLDGKRLTFVFNSEGQENINLNSLIKEMKRSYPRVRIDFRQIGPRDTAKIMGGMGACGIEKRCCSRFLTEFSPISIKMAKTQGISLAPSEITGMCGRLRCCLIYEYEQYQKAMKDLPRRGKRVITPAGEGKVINVNPIKETVLVAVDKTTGVKEFHREEVEPWAEVQALKKKIETPCKIHGEGDCNCNNRKSR
jgi:cell fate regulator YaaT (PSP1 superfamily)